ncbi:hypothetical protein MCHI_004101, partial [Candidatus Magnetoovum chiemensis]
MLSQRMTILALSIAQGNKEDRKLLNEALLRYDSSLNLLHSGGIENKEIIPPAPKELIALIDENRTVWEIFKCHT